MITDLLPRPQLAILGTGPSLRDALTEPPEAWSWWAVSTLWGRFREYDCLCELHNEADNRATGIAALLKTVTAPIYMQPGYPNVPGARAYPLAEAYEHFSPTGRERPPFGSNVDYLLALALLHVPLPTRVALWGVDMHQDGEYYDQRESIGFWIGLLMGRGVEVQLPESSEVLSRRYQYALDAVPREVALTNLHERRLTFKRDRDQTILALQERLTHLVHVNALLGEIEQQASRTR